MKPLPPEVVGPISVCNQAVRVRGHIAGAKVSILVNGNITNTEVSNWPDDDVDVGVSLAGSDRITAVQEFDGETSDPSPLEIIVQNAPSVLSSLTVMTHLYQCGRGLWVEGAVPGAEVKALINNAQLDQKTSVFGIARLFYQPGPSLSQSLTLVQSTCNNLTGNTVTSPAEALPDTLPTPVIKTPLIECQTAIPISNIVDGATVILYRNGSEAASTTFDRSGLTWVGLSPLLEGEKIEIAQAFYCDRRGTKPTKMSDKAVTKVKSIDALKAPTIVEPLCPNGVMVTLSSLVPGARVILFQDDQPFGMGDAPSSIFTFYTPPLVSGSTFTARMQLCGKDGPMSEKVIVKGGSEIEGLQPSTMYECASYIYAGFFGALSQSGGFTVYALNKQQQMISDFHQVFHWEVLLPVSPALIQGDQIKIVVVGCDASQKMFGPFPVLKLKSLPPPKLYEPITEGSQNVIVSSDVAGALLRVYVDGVFGGQMISHGDESSGYIPTVALQQPLELGQLVTATQTFCNETSRPSKPVTVVIPKPKAPLLIKPTDNATGVGAAGVTFDWQDPGSNTSAAATSFKLRLHKGNNQIHEGPTNGTSYTLNFNLDYETEYSWSVEAANSTGTTKSSSWEFTTEDEPEQPAPQEALLAFLSSLYASEDCVNVLYPVPADEAFKLFINVGNIGQATSDQFKVRFEVYDSNGQFWPPAIDVDFPAFGPGQGDTACIDVAALPAGQYTFYAYLIVNNQIVESTYYGAWIGF